MTTPSAAPPGYRRLFAVRGFPSLVAVSLSTVLGTSLQILALSVLVYARTGSALWSTVAFSAGFLPQLVGGTLLTSLADRLPVRPLLAGGALLRAAAAAVLAAFDLSPAAAVAVVAVAAVVLPVPGAAQSAYVARLLDGELYVLGRSVFTLVSSGAQLAGLAVGGAVVAAVGPTAALWIAVGIALGGLVAVAGLPAPERVRAADRGRWQVGETWRGNVALLRIPAVRRILLSWWLPMALLVGAESLVVAYVGEGGGSAAPTGFLLAAFPAGMAVGDLLVGRFLTEPTRVRAAPWLGLVVGAVLLPVVWRPPVPVTFVCFAVAAAAGAYQLCGQQTFLAAVPEDRRGLAFGLMSTGLMTAQGLGPVLTGALAEAAGAAVTIGVCGAGILALVAVLGRLPVVATPSPAPTTR